MSTLFQNNNRFGNDKTREERPTIELKYDEITLMDASKELYIVQLNLKIWGCKFDGKEVIPVEYDQIGLPDATTYAAQGINSKYVIADKCIPVVKTTCMDLYNTDGYCLIPQQNTIQ